MTRKSHENEDNKGIKRKCWKAKLEQQSIEKGRTSKRNEVMIKRKRITSGFKFTKEFEKV
ncbi:CLUMA_CG017060, isoform A [Clunio marinus]|uniref:CLUMA_CG017060, isoform A n=1 Tax=Clunio marinus TaxID=568069 RepID=A0A1J1IUK1_9DIPT|nr:CLUMA_CG017060, isoform A [Clunio marinus]